MSDLVVAGGGPVGLATAVGARLRGLSVVLFEPRNAPQDKACGEGLMPSSLSALHALGVDPDGMPFRGIRYVAGDRSVDARFRRGVGRGVRRTTLMAALRRRADEVGVVRRAERVAGAESDAGGVSVSTADGGLCCGRYLAVADGLHSPLRRALGLDRPGGGPVRYGLRRHFRVEPWSDLVEVHWARDVEAYVTPVAPDVVGVAVLCGGGSSYDEWLARFPSVQARLCGASPVSAVRGAGPLRQRALAPSRGRIMLVGDAAGYVDALTGEGMAVGFAAAAELVRCVAADRPEDYALAWRRVTRRSRLLTEALLRGSRSPGPRAALVPAAQRLPGVFGGVVNALA